MMKIKVFLCANTEIDGEIIKAFVFVCVKHKLSLFFLCMYVHC